MIEKRKREKKGRKKCKGDEINFLLSKNGTHSGSNIC